MAAVGALAATAVVVGLVSAAVGIPASNLGIYSFIENHIPHATPPHSVIRVAIALNESPEMHSDGNAPDIRLWNEYGEFLGMNEDGTIIEDGGYKDIEINQNTNQPTYVLLSANKDAICLAYILLTWPDAQTYGWIGNWGHGCNKPWSA